MICSTNFFTRAVLLLYAACIILSACTANSEPPRSGPTVQPTEARPSGEKSLKIAVLSTVNFSGASAPMDTVNRALLDSLIEDGLNILSADAVEQVIDRHRIRYLAGLDEAQLAAFRNEAGADGVLITILELYSDAAPPKIALTSRLVSTAARSRILWIDGVGMAGDDAPGLLDLNLIEDPRRLLAKAMQVLAASLAESLNLPDVRNLRLPASSGPKWPSGHPFWTRGFSIPLPWFRS